MLLRPSLYERVGSFKVHACRFVGWHCEKWERVFLYLLADLASTGAAHFGYAIFACRGGSQPPIDLSEVVMVTQHAFSRVSCRMENDYAVICVNSVVFYNNSKY